MGKIPAYLQQAYERSDFSAKANIDDFITFLYVAYRLTPNRRPHLSRDEWVKGFEVDESESP